MKNAILKSRAFNSQSKRSSDLFVTITELYHHGIGFGDSIKTVIAVYELIDEQTGESIFKESIKSDGIAKMKDFPYGQHRGREAINRAVKNNISSFLKRLESEAN